MLQPAKRRRDESEPPRSSRSTEPPGKTRGTLSALVGVPSSTFYADFWEKALLHATLANGRLPCWSTLPTFDSLQQLLRDAEAADAASVIILKDQLPTSEYPSAASAYLDGCSVIVNHVEKVCGPIAEMCASLRDDVPHAFANLYLTPPLGQAVDAHADDRDVLVVQLAGSKQWRLLGAVPPAPPIPFPMSHEQVGKAGRPVPESARDRAHAQELELCVGDVLYIPRGWVHEALTGTDAPSLHVTLAIPTHDWCWAKVAASAMRPEAARPFVQAALEKEEMGGGGAALGTALRNRQVALGTTLARPSWFWRRAVPPALICPGATAADAAAARELAAAVEEELQLRAKDDLDDCGDLLARLYEERISPHNRRQDEDEAARAAGEAAASAAAVASGAVASGACLAARPLTNPKLHLKPSSLVRRRRPDDLPPSPPPPRGRNPGRNTGRNPAATEGGEEDAGADEGGLRVRAEIADALAASLIKITADTPIAVSDFESCELLCEFGKVCFAQVCVESGLLVCVSGKTGVGENEPSVL